MVAARQTVVLGVKHVSNPKLPFNAADAVLFGLAAEGDEITGLDPHRYKPWATIPASPLQRTIGSATGDVPTGA